MKTFEYHNRIFFTIGWKVTNPYRPRVHAKIFRCPSWILKFPPIELLGNVPKTDPPKTDIVYPTIYNWNDRLHDHNRFSLQLMLFGYNLTILIVILVKL